MRKTEKTNKITTHQIFWYFVLFSILGLIIETVYGYITMGVLESRKGLIWGPFCPVYGVGATILILILNQVDRKDYIRLFVYGVFIGSIVEYILSYGLEAIYGARFWDYAYTNNDINGRICITYSFFWGVLAVLLIRFVKPFIDKIIDKIYSKIKISVEVIFLIFLITDALVTVWAVNVYETRVVKEYYGETFEYSNISIIKNIEKNYFSNERIQKIFPNLRTINREGDQVFVRDLLE